jgi:dihydrofolate reductase
VLIYSMSVSVDGFVADRDGSFGWAAPSDELFASHLARVQGLTAYLCGRRLYQTMLPWETEPSMRETPLGAEFAKIWTTLPKVVFSRTLTNVRGNARLAHSTLADEISAVLSPNSAGVVEIGGASLAASAIELGLVDELRLYRIPIVVGGGTPYLPLLNEQMALELLETRTFDPQVIYQRYRRKRN